MEDQAMRSWIQLSMSVIAFVAAAMAAASVQAAGPLLAVRAKTNDFFEESLADQVRTVPHVVKTERFLVLKSKPFDVVGIAPGGTVRIPTSDNRLLEVTIERGRPFREGDRNSALVGPKIYREDYGFKPPFGGMMMSHGHAFEPGSSFTFPDSTERMRVVGTFAVEPRSEGQRVLLPLATAQRLFGAAGKLTHLFVEIDQPANAAATESALRKLLGDKAEISSR
jgi:hypothetical protein